MRFSILIVMVLTPKAILSVGCYGGNSLQTAPLPLFLVYSFILSLSFSSHRYITFLMVPQTTISSLYLGLCLLVRVYRTKLSIHQSPIVKPTRLQIFSTNIICDDLHLFLFHFPPLLLPNLMCCFLFGQL